MITRLTLRNFKSVDEQTYDFTHFDLLVGRNNCGKSTVLQALAIWQFCVDEFHRSRRTGSKGIQVVLPNFTALPVPEFNLLWKDRTDRVWPEIDGRKKQEYILIEIVVDWRRASGDTESFGVQLRYHSPQTMYAIPMQGWAKFRDCEKSNDLPRIAYVPPFSGLEPTEKWLDIAPIRQQIGKGQPGSVLRNLLLRVFRPDDGKNGNKRKPPADWEELAQVVERWFSAKIHAPEYESEKDVNIGVEYEQGGKDYDIISAGSGFHQTLTLLAFLYGYRPTTILLDEPDAHLHVNLQREILDYFKRKSSELATQFLIATHAEEFVKGVDASQLVSLLNQAPKRVQANPPVLRAMADVSNEEIAQLISSPFIVYVEGESDERIIRAWAGPCAADEALGKIFFKAMGGGPKNDMKGRADEHFAALKEIVPEAERLLLFDFDDAQKAFHPKHDNPGLAEWKRKNIENYLLVPDAWRHAAEEAAGGPLLAQDSLRIIEEFFSGQNLNLPPRQTWRNVSANVFSVVDGKRILFENDNSLFQLLRSSQPPVELIRENVASHMSADEIHEDVHTFIGKLKQLTKTG